LESFGFRAGGELAGFAGLSKSLFPETGSNHIKSSAPVNTLFFPLKSMTYDPIWNGRCYKNTSERPFQNAFLIGKTDRSN